jgi:hypothetical protein
MQIYFYFCAMYSIQLQNEKQFRNFMIYYINRKRSKTIKTSGNPNFFTWRIKSNNFKKQLEYLENKGFVIYKVYHKWEYRGGTSSDSKLVYTGQL